MIWLDFNRAAALLAAPQLAAPLLNRQGGGGRPIRRGPGNGLSNGSGNFRGNGPRGLPLRRKLANGKSTGGNLKGIRNGKNPKGQKILKNGRRIKGRRNQDRYQLNKPWVTDEIKAAHEKKVELANQLKGNKNDELFAEFKTKRDEFVKLYDAARTEYNKNKV